MITPICLTSVNIAFRLNQFSGLGNQKLVVLNDIIEAKMKKPPLNGFSIT